MLFLAVCLAAGAMMVFVVQALLKAPADVQPPTLQPKAG
jgi:hypothetical protein